MSDPPSGKTMVVLNLCGTTIGWLLLVAGIDQPGPYLVGDAEKSPNCEVNPELEIPSPTSGNLMCLLIYR